jgi:tetratricopeptide (TPR) repeat protein
MRRSFVRTREVSRCSRAYAHALRPLATALLLLVAGSPSTAPGQIPEEFNNLQVLPEDIGQRELIAIMRSNSMGLGVRCWHCHVGEEGMPFSEYDFESDEKTTKKKARYMLKMVGHLNEEHLPGLSEVAERAEPAVEVTCYTCHRGLAVPRTLPEELLRVIEEDGIDAGVARYRELREEYYGSGSYDFGEFTLLDLAERLGIAERVDDGIAIVKLNLEFFPESGFSYFALGEGYRMTAETALAIEAYKKAQELVPDNPMIGRRLQEVQAAAEEGCN